MSEIPPREIDVPWSDEPEVWREMTPAEILERDALNRANTSERLRDRAVANLAEANGSSS